MKGHLHVAQWLLTVKPDIHISMWNEYAFRYACQYGHLAVAQWLLTVKPDINISAENEDAFRWACYKGHLDVSQWLLKTFTTHVFNCEEYHKVMKLVMEERRDLTRVFEEDLVKSVFHPTRVAYYLENHDYLIGIDEYNCI